MSDWAQLEGAHETLLGYTERVASAKGWPNDSTQEAMTAIYLSERAKVGNWGSSTDYLLSAGDMFAGSDPGMYPSVDKLLNVVISALGTAAQERESEWMASPAGVLVGTVVTSSQTARSVGEGAAKAAFNVTEFVSKPAGALTALGLTLGALWAAWKLSR